MKSADEEYVSVEFCSHDDDVNVVPRPQVATIRRSGAWILAFLLMVSIPACESFTSSTRIPGVLSLSSKPPSTILRVVETEAPAVTKEERSIAFQPSTPEHSIVCEQESSDEREPSDDDSTSGTADQQESTEARAEKDDNSESKADEEEMEKQVRLDAASRAAALLGNRKSRVKRNTTEKGTSVGARRMGAASKALGGGGTLSRITDAVRRSAGVSKGKKKQNDENNDNLSARLTQSAIHSAVGDILNSGQQPNIEVLGEASAPHLDLTKIQTTPPPGTVLVDCPKNCRWKPSDRVSVRVATQGDDLDIANLRLSVFSNFSPNMRQSFCSRSCHVLAMRRNQGATCIVATVPRYGSILSDEKDIILGTAECSIHEFFGTRLGSRRQENSILYITEVAVSPTARRKGIGAKLMQVRGEFVIT